MPQCPHCHQEVSAYRNPLPTVDIVIETTGPDGSRGIVLIERRNKPMGWALPGGFIDYGETAEEAAVREASEETGLEIHLTGLLGVYSDPERDPRHHTLSVVFTATANGLPRAGDDAAGSDLFERNTLPDDLAFDHAAILADYYRRTP